MSGAPGTSATFDTFYKDLKATEKADAVLTSKQQIDRLLRPGSTYRNLNPFEVLMVDPEISMDDIKKKYRRLSILVHPDKNQDNKERAQAAFDAVKKAYEALDDPIIRKKCYEVVEEAKGRTDKAIEEKRKKQKREGKETRVDEDDPAKYKQAVKVLTMKLFADLERKRRENEDKISTEAAKKREMELAAEERRNMEKEFVKNWEESRQGRVNSWMDFKSGKAATSKEEDEAEAEPKPKEEKKKKKKEKKEKRFSPMGFRPPKTKPEAR